MTGNVCPCCRRPTEDASVLVSLETNEMSYAGSVIKLTPREAELAYIFAKDSPRYVPRERILAKFHGSGECYLQSNTKAIEVHIMNLRQKIGPHGLKIENSKGYGYRIIGATA